MLLSRKGHRGVNGHIGDRRQEGHVENAVMGRTVPGVQPRAVDAHENGKLLQGNIVNDLVIRPLHKGGIARL